MVEAGPTVEVFYSYSHKDERFRKRIENNLIMLKREGIIQDWHDRKIGAGTEWKGAIDAHMESACVILILVSDDFLASDYCYDIEMKRALERHDRGEARLIPVILRPCLWEKAPFAKLQAVPKDGKAITTWPNRDEAYLDVARAIDDAVRELAIIYNARPVESEVRQVASEPHREIQRQHDQEEVIPEFAKLTKHFASSLPGIRSEIRDYTFIIDDKTREFVGRQFIFDIINNFFAKKLRGYFVLRGWPGVGKTALAAQLVKMNGYAHHFNSRSKGVNTAAQFLRNICAQLIARYHLAYTYIPEKASQDSDFLLSLLNEISHRLPAGERAVIVVDALDEVDEIHHASGANVLYLPETLPLGVYVIATVREGTDVRLHIECEQHPLYIDPGSDENASDIREYLQQALTSPGIVTYIATQHITRENLIELLYEKSEGNFMYLHYILPAIEAGLYKDLGLHEIPTGLQGYYETHWQRMRGDDEEAWFGYKLRIICVLAVVKEPVSIDMIQHFSGVQQRDRIIAALKKEQWGQFLQVEGASSKDKRYSLYHASFRDFISKKDEVEEGVSMVDTELRLAEYFMSKLRV